MEPISIIEFLTFSLFRTTKIQLRENYHSMDFYASKAHTMHVPFASISSLTTSFRA